MSLARQPQKPTFSPFRFSAPPKGTEGRSLWRMFAGSVLALAGLSALPVLLFGPPPLSINVSESLPVGLYWTGSLPEPGSAPGETTSEGRTGNLRVEVGMIVSACLPPQAATSALERGYLPEGTCPSGTAPVGKVIAALPGDTVDVTDSGSFVNGALLPGSVPLLRDSKGRAMPRLRGRFILPAETAWLYSGHSPRSFDSRYYGPVPLSGVRGQLFPLLTRGEAYRPFLRPIQE
ncbi:conjugative transfer signal peptidase TraF [Salinibacter ruber]|uniref:conjugative transfer signal peptidase TraF n=1 Tax=Salinibacter ruber TaxID=146919 RepID=UPI00244FB8E8|nr:conjugative transfer signal peptidase TraF [Salinibacter ruber]